MRKIITVLVTSVALALPLPAVADTPDKECQMVQGCQPPECTTIADGYAAEVADLQAELAERDQTIYDLKAYYHSKLEVIGGRIVGYKDQIRWQRHEIKRLRAKLRAAQG
jgi:hypothetical protein